LPVSCHAGDPEDFTCCYLEIDTGECRDAFVTEGGDVAEG
jgi:hypothetical protein